MKKILFCTIMSFLVTPVYPNLMIDKYAKNVKIFFSQTDTAGTYAAVKGMIMSFSTDNELKKDSLVEHINPRSRATVRLNSRQGIQEGGELFIINEKNLVVSKMKVFKVYKSASFGYMVIGKGNMRLANRGYRVVQLIRDEYARYAVVHCGRGDYFVAKNDTGKAIAEYKKALTLDKNNPRAHLSLGYIYFEKGVTYYPIAMKEFTEAYKYIRNLYDKRDKFRLLSAMVKVRFSEVFFSYLTDAKKRKFRKEGIQYARKALELYSTSVEMNYYLGLFYYKGEKGDDRRARDAFLKVVEQQPEHVGANIALAELYLAHRNKDKARRFARMALKGDPGSVRAKELLTYIDKYNR